MKNWKTTLGGFIAATGLSMQASTDEKVKLAGWIMAAIGTVFFGASAKDNNVTGV